MNNDYNMDEDEITKSGNLYDKKTKELLQKYKDFLLNFTDEVLEKLYIELTKIWPHLKEKNDDLMDEYFFDWGASTYGFNNAIEIVALKYNFIEEYNNIINPLEWYDYDGIASEIESLLSDWYIKNFVNKDLYLEYKKYIKQPLDDRFYGDTDEEKLLSRELAWYKMRYLELKKILKEGDKENAKCRI